MNEDTPTHDLLVTYLRGRMSEDEAASLEARIAGDEALAAELERTRTVLEIVDAANEETTVRRVNEYLDRGVRSRGSDLHIDLVDDGAIVRLRIDGVLHVIDRLTIEVGRACLGRLKQLLGMPPADFSRSADSRYCFDLDDRRFDVRGSYVPGLHGGRLCCRFLDASAAIVGWDELGLFDEERAALDRLIRQPCGLLIVTGPTGCGKTTLLYSLLQRIARPEINTMSVEDPVEVDLDWVAQTPIRPAAGLTFPVVLRSFMRQDPDVIIVGEIRDRETLEICCQAALTGHLVISTLHTQDAVSAIARMLDIGAPAFLLSGVLIGLVAMRLVRTICPCCKAESRPPNARVAVQLGLDTESYVPYAGQGCEECRQTGYRGRTAVYEVVEVQQALSDAIAAQSPEHILRELAFSGGMPNFRQHGARVVAEGITTAEEVARVLQQTW